MCASPVLAPHGRPAPPAPATRPSHHQRQPHIHSRRDARAAAHLTSTTSPFCALCRLCTLLLASHKRLYQDAPRVRRRFRTTQGTHARTHPHARARALIRSVCSTACQPACTHSIQHHVHALRSTMQPAPRNNSLPLASSRRLAHTPPAAQPETLQRAPLHACSLSDLPNPPRRRASPGTHRSSEHVRTTEPAPAAHSPVFDCW